jgi:ribose 5-phosphate isomerase B
MAEGLFRRMLSEQKIENVEVASAGTMSGGGSPASEGAALACRELDVDLSNHLSTGLSNQLIAWADLILCMENHHAHAVAEMVPPASSKTHLLGEFGPPDQSLEIIDPVGLPLSYYRTCRDRLSDCLRGVLGKLPEIQIRSETIALGCDETGLALKNEIKKRLEAAGQGVYDCGPFGEDAADDPTAAIDVGRRVAGRLAQTGILIGATGVGMSIAANKIPGVRAALCADPEYAVLSRELHDCNILCLGAQFQDVEQALKIIEAWLETDYKGGEENAWVAVYERLEYGKAGR